MLYATLYGRKGKGRIPEMLEERNRMIFFCIPNCGGMYKLLNFNEDKRHRA
jgi:hypothetical protein